MQKEKENHMIERPLSKYIERDIKHELFFCSQHRYFTDPSHVFHKIVSQLSNICSSIEEEPLYSSALEIKRSVLSASFNALSNLKTQILRYSKEYTAEAHYFGRKIEFALFYLSFHYGIYKNNDRRDMLQQLTDLFNEFDNLAEKYDEEWWFCVWLMIRKAEITKKWSKEDCKKIATAIENIISVEYKKDLALLSYVDYYKKLDCYPDYSLFSNIMHPLVENEYLGATYIQNCHDYIKQNLLRNKDFFKFEDIESFSLKNDRDCTLKITAGNDGKSISMQISEHSFKIHGGLKQGSSLFRFSAHITSVGKGFKLEIDNLPEVKLKKINQSLTAKLKEGGFLDSLSMISSGSKLGKKENLEPFQSILRSAIKENIPDIDEENLSKIIENTVIQKEMKSAYEDLEKNRKLLSGYNPLNALALFHTCLIYHEYGLSKKRLDDIKLASLNCYKIAKKISEIITNNAFIGKQEEFFKLAGDIMKYIKDTEKSIIIHSGNPIKFGDDANRHTFYVVLKYEKISNTVRVIVVNAGSGCSVRSKPYQHQVLYDTPQYHYVAFKPITLADPNPDNILQHYIYVLFRIRQAQATDDSTPEISFNNLLQDVYLKPPDTQCDKPHFIGYQFKNITGFERDDLDQSFMAQIAGNCVIYNLKLAIKVLFDLDEKEFGQLSDTLMLGLDQLITEFLKLNKSAIRIAMCDDRSYWVVSFKKDNKHSFINFNDLNKKLEKLEPGKHPQINNGNNNNIFQTKEQAEIALKEKLNKPLKKGGVFRGFIIELNYTTKGFIEAFQRKSFPKIIENIVCIYQYERDLNEKILSRNNNAKENVISVSTLPVGLAEVDVPSDGHCLFWSAALALLLPRLNQPDQFKTMYLRLFGNETDSTIENLKNLLHTYDCQKNTPKQFQGNLLNKLVTRIFRGRVVDALPEAIPDGDSRTAVLADRPNGTTWSNYLEYMRGDAFGGEPEIRAISQLAQVNINTYSSSYTQPRHLRFADSTETICLIHVNNNHYHFGLTNALYETHTNCASQKILLTEPQPAADNFIPDAYQFNIESEETAHAIQASIMQNSLSDLEKAKKSVQLTQEEMNERDYLGEKKKEIINRNESLVTLSVQTQSALLSPAQLTANQGLFAKTTKNEEKKQDNSDAHIRGKLGSLPLN